VSCRDQLPMIINLTSPDVCNSDSTQVGNSSWSRVLIVEGTSGVGKSTLIDQLIRRYIADRPAGKIRTFLHLTQAHTYGPLAAAEDLETLTPTQNQKHLGDVVSMLEWHVNSLNSETKVKFLAIVDSLHITQCHRPGVLSWDQVLDFDCRLSRLGAKLLFQSGSPQTL
jgi:hypothetical protein